MSDLLKDLSKKAGEFGEKALDVAGDVVEKTKEVAGNAFETAKDVAGDVVQCFNTLFIKNSK